MPMIRDDQDDEVYRTRGEKDEGILQQIEDRHSRQQPVLVGLTRIEKADTLSALLQKS